MAAIACRLPKKTQPTFPDRCVACSRTQPGAVARLFAKGPTRQPWSGWFSVIVPACPQCRSRLRWQAVIRFIRTVAVGGSAIGIGALVLYKFGLRDAALGGASFGVVFAAICAPVVWERAHPPQFKIDVGFLAVDYEFCDRQYAQEFAELNGLTFR